MAFLVAVTAIAGLSAGASAQCTPLGEAAENAGLTSLAGAIGLVSAIPGAEGLAAAVTATDELDDSEKITLFAPSNEAFSTLTLDASDPEFILDVLTNHVVSGDVPAASVMEAIAAADPNPAELETLFGAMLEASLVDGGVVVTPAGTETMAKVTETDVMTCAGTVHVVDTVLVPAEAGMPSSAPIAVADAPTSTEMAPASAISAAAAPAGAMDEGVEVADKDVEIADEGVASDSRTISAVSGVVALLSAAVLVA